ncbi:MAG: hypothetical protein QM589_09170 [Thermomicrobiales bacterium]
MNERIPPHPPLDLIQALMAALRDTGFLPTLGGSGLLFAHGLPFPVHDWDLTVDADLAGIAPVLDGLDCRWHDSTDGDPRFPGLRLAVIPRDESHTIDLMLYFAVRPGISERPVAIPSIVDGEWNNLPLGSLPAWLVAYRLMKRPYKPEAIASHLHVHGVDAAQRDRLLAEPLPENLREELLSFPPRP